MCGRVDEAEERRDGRTDRRGGRVDEWKAGRTDGRAGGTVAKTRVDTYTRHTHA